MNPSNTRPLKTSEADLAQWAQDFGLSPAHARDFARFATRQDETQSVGQ